MNEIRDMAASTLDWWQTAGVDVLVDDAPRDWLRPAPAATPVAAAPPPPAAPRLPGTLADLHAWLANSEALPGNPPPRLRLPPLGNASSGVMIVTDLPDEEDVAAGHLFAGTAGRLLDRMLAAIGRDREAVYLAPLAPCRPPGGRLSGDSAPLADLMRHHIALAQPRLMLLLGDAPARALLGMRLAEARGGLRDLKHDGGNVPAVTTFHPRFLLGQPACKADAWRDLRLLLGGLSR